MRYFLSTLFLMAAALILPVPVAHAATETFVAFLNGANDGTPSLGTGLATVVLDPVAQTLQVNATFSGLTSPTITGAHIHCCQLQPGNPATVGVATTTPVFPGFPQVGTSGIYSSQVFDLTQPLIYNPAFITAQGSLAAAEAALIAGIEGGVTYFNIHTSNFPGGEIRGQLNAVPLPTALPLFATGLGALGLLAWRRKRKATAGF
jgi:hypothetical protein